MHTRIWISLASVTLLAAALGRAQWTPATTCSFPALNNVFAISGVDSNVVWAVLDSALLNPNPVPPDYAPKFVRTTNGGASWSCGTINTGGPILRGHYIFDISAVNGNIAWIATNTRSGDGGIYKTTDGGQTWSLLLQLPSRFVHFYDALHGVIVNRGTFVSTPIIATTTNGGDTWEDAVTIPSFDPNEVDAVFSGNNAHAQRGDTIWFPTSKGRVYRSTNKGRDWTIYQTSLGRNASIGSIAFQDGRNGLVLSALDSLGAVAPNKAARTTNGGLTWITLTPPSISRAACLEYVPGTSGVYVIVSPAGGSIYTTNSGDTWVDIDLTELYRAVAFVGPNKGWAGGYTGFNPGALYRWSGTSLTEVGESASLPERFMLMQNYPNPFNPSTRIVYRVGSRESVSLRVYDVLGREVATLVNEVKQPGSYEVSWVASGFASGVYLYRLQAGNYIDTKKLILLK
jgi:photosystem II stability/assembly factor-like uncharacterized protein